jgi:hypothetical protein
MRIGLPTELDELGLSFETATGIGVTLNVFDPK